MSEEIRIRIQSRLDALDMKARAASLAAKMSPDAVRGIFRNPDSSPTVETIRKLADALKVTPEWLAFGIEDGRPPVAPPPTPAEPHLLPIIGEVAAGRWLEADDFVDVALFDPIPVTLDPRWPAEDQYGLVIRGTSLNRFAEDGDVLACVNAVAARYRRPRENDLVIVEMRRNAGFLRQLTAKRYMRQGNHVELWPDSNDERWKKPIIIPLTEDGRGAEIEDDDGRIEVRVKAMVTWLHRPMQARR